MILLADSESLNRLMKALAVRTSPKNRFRMARPIWYTGRIL